MLKKYNSIFFAFLISFIFITVNLPVVFFLSLSSGNAFLEFFKWLQFIILILLTFYTLKKINKLYIFFIINIFYFFYLILVFYHIITGGMLDAPFLKRNIADVSAIFLNFIYYLLFIFILSLLNSLFICKLKKYVTNYYRDKIIIIILIIFFIPFLFIKKTNNEFIFFIRTIYQNDKVITCYQNFYNNLINQSKLNKEYIKTQAKEIDHKNLPEYLDNIIILQIESLNGFLVNKKNTPNFIKIAKEGIFFPKFYGNSTQTILAQENILCSLPSSFTENLISNDNNKEILCLPEILNEIGYKTFFLKSYRLSFNNTGNFMNSLKFKEIHACDIMDSNNPQYTWGYREDVFYKQAFDYFKNNKNDKYNFAYIEIGPSNHWPFNTPEELKNEVPYKTPKNHREKLANTTFLQDKYLEMAIEKIKNIFPKKNYTLLILGDHSWPAELHKKNNFNQKNSYEENFITSAVMIIGDDKKYKNKIIQNKYSHMNIMPTILDMFGIIFPENDFNYSFWKELNEEKTKIYGKTILIQPYSDKYINIINDDLKYQYNSEKNNFNLYNLKNDPEEIKGKIIGKNKTENLKIIKQILEIE